MRYSPSAKCFYPKNIEYKALPDDIVEIKESEFIKAMNRPHDASFAVNNGTAIIVGPTPEERLQKIKDEKILRISSSCANEICSDFASSALGSEHFYGNSQTDQINLFANIQASLYPGVDETWVVMQMCRDQSGLWECRPHTADQIRQVGADSRAKISAALSKKDEISALVIKAETQGEIEPISWLMP